MRIEIAFLMVLAGAAPVLAAPAEESYRCECCGAYFGKDPNAPSYWRKIGYARLLRDRKYEEMVSRFNDAYRDGEYVLGDVGWMGEAMYALGALRSGLPDPLKPLMFFQAEKPQDMVGHDVWWMHAKYGGRIWDTSAIERYGRPAVCAITEIRKEDPRTSRYFHRHLELLIATGQFDEVLREISAARQGSLEIRIPLGEYLAAIMQQYIGMSRYEEGAVYLATVRKLHGLSDETREHWRARLRRAVQDAALTAEHEQQIEAKIRAI